MATAVPIKGSLILTLSTKLDFDAARTEAFGKNINGVRASIDGAEMKKKIALFSRRHGISQRKIRNEIKTSDVVCAFFAKDPAKQNIYQKTAADWITNIPGVRDFLVLPNGGPSALFVTNGIVLTGEQCAGAKRPTKSIDFAWICHNGERDIRFYATHKYTHQQGGGQDNQYADLHSFVVQANACLTEDRVFLVLADGLYYDQRDASAGVSRLEYLRRLANNKSVFVMRTEDLPAFFESRKVNLQYDLALLA